MAEPSQTRVDLSGIHPLKRLTLIGLGFMFGVSLVLALVGQFAWVSARLDSPRERFSTTVGSWGLELTASSRIVASTSFNLQYSHSGSFKIAPRLPLDQLRRADSRWVADFYPVPGLAFHRVYNRFFAARIVVINPLLLISITAALYLFARWRIRRTARLQNRQT